jgi:hypothetical protein
LIVSQVDVDSIPCQELDNLKMTMLSCQMERRRSSLAHLVQIGFSLHKTLGNLKMAMKICCVQGCLSLSSLYEIWISPTDEKEIDKREVLILCGEHQRSVSLLISSIDHHPRDQEGRWLLLVVH